MFHVQGYRISVNLGILGLSCLAKSPKKLYVLISEGAKFLTMMTTIAFEVQAYCNNPDSFTTNQAFVDVYKNFITTKQLPLFYTTKLFCIFIDAPNASKASRCFLELGIDQNSLHAKCEHLDGKMNSHITKVHEVVDVFHSALADILPDKGVGLKIQLQTILCGQDNKLEETLSLPTTNLSPTRQLSNNTLDSTVQGINLALN